MFWCIFPFSSSPPQNDQSTEELHIIGSRDLSFLRGKVSVNKASYVALDIIKSSLLVYE